MTGDRFQAVMLMIVGTFVVLLGLSPSSGPAVGSGFMGTCPGWVFPDNSTLYFGG